MTIARRRLVVVGGGILGTMHALEGLTCGYEVLHLERDIEPRGASVRNFGLVWVGGRAAGAELELALRARHRWEEIAAVAPGIGFRANGSLTIATSTSELEVFEEVVARPDASRRGFSLLTPEQARAMNPALAGNILAALHCSLDAAVEPRRALAALRGHCAALGSYRFLPGCSVVEAARNAVRDQHGTWHRGDLVVCCIGADPGGLFAEMLARAPVRRVRLQMLETTPIDATVTTSIADGDSLRYYPAYAGAALARLEPQHELAAAWAAQLLLVQRLGGHLTIGDTHSYNEPFAFDLDDAPYIHLLGVASRLLDRPLEIERRWEGIYSQVTDDRLLYLRQEVLDGVVIVTGPGGRGMTMSPAIAEESFT